MLLRSLLAASLLCLSGAAFGAGDDIPPGGTILDLDLSRPFGLSPGWHLLATQAPPLNEHGDNLPGRITLCIRGKPDGRCSPALETAPVPDTDPQHHGFHFLDDTRIVYPHGSHGRPLLLVQASSLEMFDGNRDVITQLLAYDPAKRDFKRVYRLFVGRNNNEEVRYIGSGPLKGDIISAVPQHRLPYGYWITVSALTPAYTYRQVLRYGSATIYADGNPLGVIDSEMPNIQRRLGLWHPGMKLPLPAHCPKPHLVRTALWCQ